MDAIPLGTLVLTRGGLLAHVSDWCRQDAWNVPVDVEDGTHRMVARPSLRLVLKASDPLLGPLPERYRPFRK